MLDPVPLKLVEGMGVVFKLASDVTAPCTLNVNELGAIPVVDSEAKPIKQLKAGGVYTVRYNGTSFILQAKGGGVDVLEQLMRISRLKQYVVLKTRLSDEVMIVEGEHDGITGIFTTDLEGTVLYRHKKVGNHVVVTENEVIHYYINHRYNPYGTTDNIVVTDYYGNELFKYEGSMNGVLIGYIIENNSIILVTSNLVAEVNMLGLTLKSSSANSPSLNSQGKARTYNNIRAGNVVYANLYSSYSGDREKGIIQVTFSGETLTLAMSKIKALPIII